MKRFLLPILLLACVPVVAYVFATRIMPPVDAYRSPLKDRPPAPGGPLGSPLTRRVVFVLIDGLRLDVSQNPQVMPYLNALRSQGASAAMRSRAPSISTPSYGVLMTGAWQGLSDVPTANLTLETLWPMTQDNLFAITRRSGGKTAISAHEWFGKLIPAEYLDAAFFVPGVDQAADQQVVEAVMPWLNDPSYTFLLIHLDQVDDAGHHEGGGASEGYAAAANRVDELLRKMAAPLDLAQDTLVIASDHGHLDVGGHGGPEAIATTEPFVLVGAGVVPGQYPEIQMVDFAPTLAALLGGNLPASTQGRVQAQMLALSPERRARLGILESSQQARLLEALRSATGLQIEPAVGEQHPSQALQDALVDALDPGFTGRALAALAGLGVLVAVVVVWALRRRRMVLWAFCGSFGYVIVFHELYTVILERTYSLSSVESASDLVLATAKAAVPAFLFAWLVIWLMMRWFEETPSSPARAAIELILAVLTVLLLPVLVHLAWNGPQPRYQLPEYWTMFLGLLALVQMVIVVPVGLLIAGFLLAMQKFRQKNRVTTAEVHSPQG